MIDVIKSLADPTRLRLIGILECGEFTVQDLVSILRMGQSRVSRHLKILVDAGICSVRRQGTWSYFRLSEENDFFRSIRNDVVGRLPAIAGSRDDRLGLARILEARRERSRQFFDQHAQQWDKLASEMVPTEQYAPFIMNEIAAADTVVDAGSGTGRLLKELSVASRHVIGIDHSSSMLEEARRRIASEALDNVELRLGELAHLPVADASANCAVLNMVLHHAADPQVVLRELRRLLVPGGRLIIADLQPHDQEWFHERMADQWMGFDRDELERWLTASGYRVGRYRKIETDGGGPDVFVLTAEKTKQP